MAVKSEAARAKRREYNRWYIKQPENKARVNERQRIAYRKKYDPEKQKERVKIYKDRRVTWERTRRLKRNYGITDIEYLTLFNEQRGLCAICGQKAGEKDKVGKRPHIDHNHATGKVRGLLCGTCNRGLGQFKDSPELLEQAAMYLRKHVSSKDSIKLGGKRIQ